MKTLSCPIVTALFMIVLFTSIIYAQKTIIQLPTSDYNSEFRITQSSGDSLLVLHGNGGLYIVGDRNGSASTPINGPGGRMMWYPGKSAFRAGYVDSLQFWHRLNIGDCSMAFGRSTTAYGDYSTAMGYYTAAGNEASTAMGAYTTASADYSTAMGYRTTASANLSTAMGSYTNASGLYSFASGNYTTSSGNTSTAMGAFATAAGDYSFVAGRRAANTDITHDGVFIFADASNYDFPSTAANQFRVRSTGGAQFITSLDGSGNPSAGVNLAAGANSWTALSDSTKKTNYEKSDGEYFLKSLSNLRLGSWNYKSQDAKSFRHYGPMAQEIFHYFGKDSYGTIGNETTLATADMDGIMMICLQALEKRTADLKSSVDELRKANETIAEHENKIKMLERKLEKISNILISSIK